MSTSPHAPVPATSIPALDRRPSVFVSAAEPSGDRHAADLIRAIRRLRPETVFWGVAGPAMQRAGCEAIDDLTSRAAMLVGAVGLASHAFRLIRRIGRMAAAAPPDVAILVDSPALHLPMARKLRRAGCPVLYYIAPQLWAWAPWRIRRVRRRVDRMAVILPFEEAYFRDRGVDARYVGHPLMAQLAAERPDPRAIEDLRRVGQPVVACLAGSRRHVIEEVLPGEIEVARAVAGRYPKAAFLFAAANDAAAGMIESALAGSGLNHRIEIGRNPEVLSAADLALCASGTATIEVAYHRVPMVVMYNGSKWGYRLVGRFLIQTPHLCLVNILAGQRIVPEFMPYYVSTEPIAREALNLLEDTSRRETMRADLDAVIRSLGTADAAEQAARMAVEMMETRSCRVYGPDS